MWTPLYAEVAVTSARALDALEEQGCTPERAALARALALAPYPAWCAFATVLTVAIARRNPRGA